MNLNSTFRKIARAFEVEFDGLPTEIDHGPSAGQARENVLKALLRKYLPKRVGVEDGFVIDAAGGQSKQIDVVIYDNTVGTFFETGGVKYFPCEAVIAAGEVKSHVDSTTKLDDCLNKIASVKRLDRSNQGKNRMITGPGISIEHMTFDPNKIHRDQILGFIFTSTSLTRDALVEGLRSYLKKNPRQLWPNVYCDWRRHLVSFKRGDLLYPSSMDATKLYCTDESEVKDLLVLFYSILATFVDEAHVARPNYFIYAQVSETNVHDFALE